MIKTVKGILILFVSFVLVFSGCAKKVTPPQLPAEEITPEITPEKSLISESEKEEINTLINRAQVYLIDAKAAGALKYAKELYENAELLFASAKDAFEKSDYIKAKKDAEDACTTAIKAKDKTIKKIQEEKRLLKEKRAKERQRLAEQKQKEIEEAARLKKQQEEEQRALLAKKRLEQQKSEKKPANKALPIIIIIIVVAVVAIILITSAGKPGKKQL